ncbi:MAG: NAD-dependent epimerase/dehydratase family protein [Acidimicrobiia bacterium]
MSGPVLVTGGAGFIGVNLARGLAAAGIEAWCFDDFSTGHRHDAEAAGFARVLEGDVTDPASLGAAVRGAHAVVHLAAQPGVPASVQDPMRDLHLNVVGTVTALLAARDAGVERFVLASSNAPLGEVVPPAHEEVVPRPRSPYGASKLAAEAYCSAFGGAYGLRALALRFANVYGPFSYHKGSAVAAFMKAAVQGEPLVVHGDGSQTRDFVYVGDICAGLVAGLDAPEGTAVVHLGTGIETAVSEVVAGVAAAFPDRELVVEHRPPRAGDVQRNCADIGLARKVLGYAPGTSLAEGLAATADWFRATQGTTPR